VSSTVPIGPVGGNHTAGSSNRRTNPVAGSASRASRGSANSRNNHQSNAQPNRRPGRSNRQGARGNRGGGDAQSSSASAASADHGGQDTGSRRSGRGNRGRRPDTLDNNTGVHGTTARPDSRYSYDRAKSRGDRPDYRTSYGQSKARGGDRRRGDDAAGRGHGKNGKHKGQGGKKGHKGGHNKGHKGGYDDHGGHHGEYGDHHDNHDGYDHAGSHNGHHGYGSHHNKHHKTVNNYYGYGYGGYGYGYGYGGYGYSHHSPHYGYSFGYYPSYGGLGFSIGYDSYLNDWYGGAGLYTYPSYSSGYYGSNYYGTNYYGNRYYGNSGIVVIDDDEPDVVYVPVEKPRETPDFSVGWEHLAAGRDDDALKYFSTRVQRWSGVSAAKAGYALAAAQMRDRSRAVWSMRRAFRIDDGALGYLPLDTRLRQLVELQESRFAYDADDSAGRDRRDALFMVAALRYIQHEPDLALEAAYQARDEGDHDSSLTALIRNAEADLDY